MKDNRIAADHQPDPVPNASRPIWDLVIEDMRARDTTGRLRYGTPLQAHNGRDPLVDAYQEALDLVVYLRQAIAERDGRTQAERTYNAIRCPRCSSELVIVAGGTHATCGAGCGDVKLRTTAPEVHP